MVTVQEAHRILGVPLGTEKKEIKKNETSCDPKSQTAKRKRHEVWDAPVNENAFVEREVLQYVEDHDGTVLGNSICSHSNL